MEQKERIRLTTKCGYELEERELKRMYLAIALFMYQGLREPNYNEEELLKRLYRDFKSFAAASQSLSAQHSNDLWVNKMYQFFDRHNTKIKALASQSRE